MCLANDNKNNCFKHEINLDVAKYNNLLNNYKNYINTLLDKNVYVDIIKAKNIMYKIILNATMYSLPQIMEQGHTALYISQEYANKGTGIQRKQN